MGSYADLRLACDDGGVQQHYRHNNLRLPAADRLVVEWKDGVAVRVVGSPSAVKSHLTDLGWCVLLPGESVDTIVEQLLASHGSTDVRWREPGMEEAAGPVWIALRDYAGPRAHVRGNRVIAIRWLWGEASFLALDGGEDCS